METLYHKEKGPVFRPFLSFQVLKYIGAILITISQFTTLSSIYYKVYETKLLLSPTTITILKNFSSIGLPLVMIAVLAGILYNRKSIKLYLAFYLVCAVAFPFIEKAAITLYLKFIFKTTKFNVPVDVEKSVSILAEYVVGNYFSLNIFVDYFLVALMYFFMFYIPKKYINIKVFRSFVAIPILYVVVSYILLALARYDLITFNLYTNSFLTTKNYTAYVLILTVLIYLKVKNEDDNHWTVPATKLNYLMIITMVFLCVFDYFISYVPNIYVFGMGTSYPLFLSIPFIFFFNYREEIKHPWITFTMPLYYLASFSGILYYYSKIILDLLDLIFKFGESIYKILEAEE